ncbi:S39A7 protein, partial [Mesembrinibis cayennensis]|nr:S39A7 protein [Mesembrinibis cayennensis]
EDPHHGHGHSHEAMYHGHSHEDPHHGHGHSHEAMYHGHSHEDPHHGHGHSHEDLHHGHSHEAMYHGHSHEDPHHGHGHSHEDPHHGPAHEDARRPSHERFLPPDPSQPPPPRADTVTLWMHTMAATLVISAAPYLVLFLIPVESNAPRHQALLKLLLSFAAGGLLGDAFLHLIPHALGEWPRQEHARMLTVGMWVLAGIVAFLVVETFVRHAKGGGHGHGHGHGHGRSHPHGGEVTGGVGGDADPSHVVPCPQGVPSTPSVPSDHSALKCPQYSQCPQYPRYSHYPKCPWCPEVPPVPPMLPVPPVPPVSPVSRCPRFPVSAGLPISARPCPRQGTAVPNPVPCPQAMRLQLVTALGAVAGAACSLLAEGAGEAATLGVLPFTAGGFIYVGTVSVIPELLRDAGPLQSFLQVLGLLAGVAMMVVIAHYE